jgi:uncharacterized protein (TIGR03792 family)
MVIEELRVSVPPDMIAQFVAADDLIWTAALSAQPGFVGKEIWRVADRPDEVRIVIRWASREDWKAVPRDLLEATEQRFVLALGRSFPVQTCTDLEVVDIPRG